MNQNKKWKFFLLLLLSCLLISGCGKKDEALETYKANMEKFYELIAERGNTIDTIDATSETAVKDLLENLDAMSTLFNSLAELEVPKQFVNTETLADDAATYMAEAVTLYHDAFSNGQYNSLAADAALENYNRAMKRVQYIADILKGEIPEGDDVIVTEFDEDMNEVIPEEVPTEEVSVTPPTEEVPSESIQTEDVAN